MKKKNREGSRTAHTAQAETECFGYGLFDPVSRSVYVDDEITSVEEAGALLDAVLKMDRNPPAQAMPFSFKKRNPQN